MDTLTYWKLCTSFTPAETAALIVGALPEDICINGIVNDVQAYYLGSLGTEAHEHDAHFRAVLTALAEALRSGVLTGNRAPIGPGKFHLGRTRINTDDIRIWLGSRGITSGFFFPQHNTDLPAYLDQSHPHYAPKLAAAIRAWEAVTSEQPRLRGKTPKQAIKKWLTENAAQYGLTKNDGTPNNQGVEEISKLANWKPDGGVSKTPCN